jgi:hypothetical protein
MDHAALYLVPDHLREVRARKEDLIDKTKAAVQDRLTKEINYWDHRAATLKDQELAGKLNAKLNSGKARERADELMGRLLKRLAELEQERKLSPLPPVVLGGAMIVPASLLQGKRDQSAQTPPNFALNTEESEVKAMNAVMEQERQLGFEPRDVSQLHLGYDIESSIPGTGQLRFIEVKGRVRDAEVITVTRNEVLTALNKPGEFILAIVLLDANSHELRYCRQPFEVEPEFSVTSINYRLTELWSRGQRPS